MSTSLKDRKKSQQELFKDKPEFKQESNKEDPLFNLRKKILKLRIEKGLSQTELAKIANTRQAVISRLERGTSEPTFKTIKNIANALDKEIKIDIF